MNYLTPDPHHQWRERRKVTSRQLFEFRHRPARAGDGFAPGVI